MNDHFLRAILEKPTNDTNRLVYADWLEEQGDEESLRKAEFLRISAASKNNQWSIGQRAAKKRRLKLLATNLDSAWLAVASRPPIENCGKKPYPTFSFNFLCDRQWDELQPTDDSKIRRCDECIKSVHFCDSIEEAHEHAWNQNCVAINLSLDRLENDLAQPRMLLRIGMPAPLNDSVQPHSVRDEPPQSEHDKRRPRKKNWRRS